MTLRLTTLFRTAQTFRFIRAATFCGMLSLCALLLPACAGNDSKASGDYVTLYNQGNYSQAYDAAMEASRTGPSASREQAALIAGLSAASLDRNADATASLTPLLKSNDRIIAGKAGSQLGLIAFEQDRHQEAAGLLTEAHGKLGGDEAARAALYAGDAYRAMGDKIQAEQWYEKARASISGDQALHTTVSDRLASLKGQQLGAAAGKFTVSLGSFSTYSRAQMQADRHRARAQSANLATPRIVKVNVGGKQLYGVRVGRFQDRGSADRARQQLGSEAKIATTEGEQAGI